MAPFQNASHTFYTLGDIHDLGLSEQKGFMAIGRENSDVLRYFGRTNYSKL